MWNAFEQRVHNIDWHEEGEENKKNAVIRVVMLFVIDKFIDRGLGWKKQERSQIQDRR
jgi:hypothetical protein